MKFSLFIQLERKDGRWAASRRTTKPGNAEILKAETIYVRFVASVYERTAVLRNTQPSKHFLNQLQDRSVDYGIPGCGVFIGGIQN